MQFRVGILHNGSDSSVQYATELQRQILDESHTVNVYDERPLRDALPVRAVPTVAVILFADTMEEQREVARVLSSLNMIREQAEVLAIVDALIEAAGVNLTSELSDRIINIFYGG